MEKGRMTTNRYPYNALFQPIQINSLQMKNRLVMAPMGNISMCDETGRPNEKMLSYFIERAKGGVGLITTGLIPVTQGIDNTLIEPGRLSYFPRLNRSRTVFAGWRDLTAGVHAHGARIFIQISAGLGRVGNPQCLLNQKKFPGSASFNPNWYIPQIPSLRFSDHSCNKMIQAMGQCAADAKVMNLDGVYLHGHEGYLLEQMANPAFNRRKLGKYADWQRFGMDTVKQIRKRTNERYPIMYRLDLSLALNETYGEKMNTVPALRRFRNGRTIAQTLDYMENLVKAGVDIFDVDLGCYDNWWLPHPPGPMPPGCYLDVAQLVKAHFEKKNVRSNAGLPVPIVGVGKLGYPDLAEDALTSGKCDMIMLGRPLLADPQWPNKVRTGRVSEITPCIGCQEACLNEFVEGGHPQCAVNPRTAFEELFPETPAKTETPQKIAVVGAGPAGITCAVTAAQRGHSVTLFEKENAVGGRLQPGSKAKIKYELENYLVYLRNLVQTADKRYDFTLQLKTPVTAKYLKASGFDKVVVAAGTRDTVLRLPGYEQANICQAVQLFDNPGLAKDTKQIVIIGGGVVGCEAAYYLKKELGKDVTIIEMMPVIMSHVCTANRCQLLKYMEDAGVRVLSCTKLLSYGQNAVRVAHNVSKSVPNPFHTWNPQLPENIPNPLAPRLKEEIREETLPADLVVLAAGGVPNENLFHDLQQALEGVQVFNIGDSFQAGKVFEATKSGYRMALSL